MIFFSVIKVQPSDYPLKGFLQWTSTNEKISVENSVSAFQHIHDIGNRKKNVCGAKLILLLTVAVLHYTHYIKLYVWSKVGRP